jgi:superfamily I DNA/RNA helicase/mRNA-degrading endonuclease RelE of RelBE toxin-antitoxin system
VARLAIAKSFLSDYAKLQKPVQALVESAMAKFEDHTFAGVHLEKVHNSRDPRLRTIRIDEFWRGIVLVPDSGDTYCLLTVLPHDKAYEYAASHRCTVNQVLGILEIRDEAGLEQFEPALPNAAASASTRLFSHVSDADMRRLGIDDKTLPAARILTSEAELDAIQKLIPEAQATALFALACGMSVEDAWREVAPYLVPDIQHPVNTSDLITAMKRSPDQIVFVSGHAELQRILADPFAAWRIFLHPSQRKIAYATRYAGPAQVTGGAGTGKTVTALHRAAHLATQESAQLFATQADVRPPILLTTFTRNLADSLQRQFDELAEDAELRTQVEVLNVDRVAHHIVAKAHGSNPPIVKSHDLQQLWTSAATDAGHEFTPTFLSREWEQVILAQDLHTEHDYLSCSRAGQGVPLGKSQRGRVWQIVQRVVGELNAAGMSTHLQLANEATHIVRRSLDTPYRHVIVDEAQDLHPAQWGLLRAAVPRGPDDLFIVGDPHQRIYDHHVSLNSLGINVRGRSRRLTMNYRTTQEILAWAVPRLGRNPVTGIDDEVDSLVGYRSPMHGGSPVIRHAATRDEELWALVERLRDWMTDGIEPHAIGIAARSGYAVNEIKERLKAAGMQAVSLAAIGKRNTMRVGTMHSMKGLEFQAVAVIGVAEGAVPAPSAVTSEAADPVAHALDLQRERCVLFVACTRARDHLYVSYSGAPSPFLG